MILVGRYRSPYVRRVAVALHCADVPFDRKVISPITDLDALRIFNPMGRAPVLILDDGERLIESSAILDHVQEIARNGYQLLAPSGSERRRVLQLAGMMTNVLEKAIYASYETTRRPAEKIHPPVIQFLHEQCRAGLEMIEAMVGAFGDMSRSISISDITVAVGWSFLRDFAPALLDDRLYRRTAALSARCESLPAFAACPPEPLV
jgi:glutathione S-transferase